MRAFKSVPTLSVQDACKHIHRPYIWLSHSDTIFFVGKEGELREPTLVPVYSNHL